MAFLQVIQGSCPGQVLELTGERSVIGRHPNCEIVLDNAAVSRHHAQILETHGRYYLEDLRSRNRTRLNDQMIEGRVELSDDDSIMVCDVVFCFHTQVPSADHPWPEVDQRVADLERDTNELAAQLSGGLPGLEVVKSAGNTPSEDSSIITTINARSGSDLRLGVKPEAKLRAVLEIGRTLASVLDLDAVLQKTLDGLFQMFPQADEGFVLLADSVTGRNTIKATRTRSGRSDASIQFSMTIVEKAMQSGEAILSADALEDQRFLASESIADLQIKSMMCVPLIDKSGDSLGVVQLDSMDIRRQFLQDDLDLLVSVTSQVSMALENARLHEKLIAQRDIDRDLEFATQIQLGFLPNQRPKIDGFEFCDYYEAALRVGGDFFDYVGLPDGKMAVALGDVAGKGITAALLMARLYPTARFHLLTHPTIAEAVTRLNAEIASSGLGYRFITFVVAVVDPATHEVIIANAGHLPPLVRRNNGEVEIIGQSESGMPLGIAPDQQFNETKVHLEPGETLILFTDGVTEAMNPDSDIYGSERLSQFLADGPGDLGQLAAGIVGDVERFCDGRGQRDDMCLVCLKRTG